LTIKQGDLQFVAYLRQKHQFTSPVRSAVHALKCSSKHGNQSLLIYLYCVCIIVLWRNKMDRFSRIDLR